MDQNVVWFYIPVHYVVARQHFEGLNNLSQIDQAFLLGEGTLFLHEFVKSSPVAKLIDEVEVVGSLEHIDILHNVRTSLEG